MKNFLCVFLCTMIMFCLGACGSRNGEPTASSSDAASQGSWVDARFAEAEKLYSWFTGCGKPACDKSDTMQAGDTVYVRVTEPGLTDMSALNKRLNEHFTEDIAASLVKSVVYSDFPFFRDFDGALYFCTDASGQVPWDIGQRTASIISQTDSEIVYHLDISHDYYSSAFAASYDYWLVLGEDGQWRFASFRLPALLIAEQMFQSDHNEE